MARRPPTPPISRPVRNPAETPEASVAPGEDEILPREPLHRGTFAHLVSEDKVGADHLPYA